MTQKTPDESQKVSLSRRPAWMALLLAAAGVAIGDFLLLATSQCPTFAWGIFGIFITASILWIGPAPRQPRFWLLVVLLCGAWLWSLIQPSLINFFLQISLLLLVIGEMVGKDHRWGYHRTWACLLGILGTPFCYPSLISEEVTTRPPVKSKDIFSALYIAFWVLLLTLTFSWLFSMGNEVFHQLWTKFWQMICDFLAKIDIDFGRVFSWMVLFFVMLGLFRPLLPKARISPPPLPFEQPQGNSFWLATCILIAVNCVFTIANSLDSFFLWANQTLPAGVDYKKYVHEGTESLIVAVILTGIVLTILFRQSQNTGKFRLPRILASVWIVQNLFLVSSVCLRLKMYIDAYGMTVIRFYLITFLLVVSIGFIFLLITIWQAKDFWWLVNRNVIQSLTILYVIQFLNFDGWAGQINMNRPDPPVEEMCVKLGPGAWKILAQTARENPSKALYCKSVLGKIRTRVYSDEGYTGWADWRSVQLAIEWNRKYLPEEENTSKP